MKILIITPDAGGDDELAPKPKAKVAARWQLTPMMILVKPAPSQNQKLSRRLNQLLTQTMTTLMINKLQSQDQSSSKSGEEWHRAATCVWGHTQRQPVFGHPIAEGVMRRTTSSPLAASTFTAPSIVQPNIISKEASGTHDTTSRLSWRPIRTSAKISTATSCLG